MIDFDGNMYLVPDFLIGINKIKIGSINVTLRKVNVKSYGFDETYMGKDLIEEQLFQIKNNILIK